MGLETHTITVDFIFDDEVPQWREHLTEEHERYIKDVAREIGCPSSGACQKAQVNVLLTGEAVIRHYNAVYRGKDAVTNVLAFPMEDMHNGEHKLLGDIILCLPQIVREAQEEGVTVHERSVHMLVHGFLHLLGYTHETREEQCEMETIESRFMVHWGMRDPWAKNVVKG